ncbi:unnamed protein product [Brachionus calyciflorus]|uniref:Protein max n=1 Tax=Brachionus calyciflorus TaxID=104777 RepID=A0A813MRA6_9BILA|nr:unnamed protein product [Brachionus calyciflorus]
MRLKTTLSKQIQLLQNKNSLLIGEDNRSNDLMLNGSNTSTSSSSASAGVDDLEMDSADDDEIDVGTNADYSHSSNQGISLNDSFTHQLSSAALNGINNDHQFGANSSIENSKQIMSGGYSSMSEADRKRAHHNALERKRRDHIKDSFHTLRDAVPNIRGEKTSRAQILKAATDYIKIMRNRNSDFQNDIDNLKKSNLEIENQIRQLEKARQSALAASNSQSNKPTITTIEPKIEPVNHSVQDSKEDFKFDLNETFSSNQIVQNNANNTLNSNTFQLNLNQPLTQSLSNSTNSNQVLILNKPTTITTTSLTNSKKLKTIINTKNNLNIINLNTTSTNPNNTTTNSTNSNLATHTLNSVLRTNDPFDNYL